MSFQAGPHGELNGKDILVRVESSPGSGVFITIGSQRGVTFNEATAPIDISSKESRAAYSLPGRYSSTVTLEHLYIPSASGYNALKAAMRDGTYIELLRSEDHGSGQAEVERASAVCTGLNTSGPDNDAAVVSADFTINGEWDEA